MFEEMFVLSYSTGSTVQGHSRSRTLIMHKQVIDLYTDIRHNNSDGILIERLGM